MDDPAISDRLAAHVELEWHGERRRPSGFDRIVTRHFGREGREVRAESIECQ